MRRNASGLTRLATKSILCGEEDLNMDVQKQDRQIVYSSVVVGFVMMVLLAILKIFRVL